MRSSLKILLFWVAAVWGAGVWRGWWNFGWRSAGVAALIALVLAVSAFAQAHGTPPAPASPQTLQAEIERFRHNAQQRSLRLLRFQAASDWPNERADDEVWVGVKFFIDDLSLLVRVAVSPIIHDENMTPEQIQAFAKNYFEQQLGFGLVRNEISTFSGHPCVLSEAVHPTSGIVRRYSFSLQMSEYCIQFTSASEAHFQASAAFMTEFIQQCWLELPNLEDIVALDGRVIIGISANWRLTSNQPECCCWETAPGTLKVRLLLVGNAGARVFDQTIFQTIPGFQERAGMRHQSFRMQDNGVSVVRAGWTTPAFGSTLKWAMDAVRLPSGLVVALETEHNGSESDTFEGLLLEPLRFALIASLRDAGVPVL